VNDDVELAEVLAEEAGALLVELRAGTDAPAPDGQALGALGDRRSNELILSRLAVSRPADAVLSEESADSAARLDAARVWIVDPLDGTREYGMAGRPDWAVHIALWQGGVGITAAAVALPALGLVVSTANAAALRTPMPARPRIVVSESRAPGFVGPLAEQVGADLRSMGSAGFKAMAVVRGEAEAYVHAGGQWEWDSAAPVGVALAAELHASRLDGSPLLYNQAHPYLPDLLICRSELAEALLGALAQVGAA
jgi:3'(2'), 5'-bisphosphate nucleotidase